MGDEGAGSGNRGGRKRGSRGREAGIKYPSSKMASSASMAALAVAEPFFLSLNFWPVLPLWVRKLTNCFIQLLS